MIALTKDQTGNETLTWATIGILGITALLEPLLVPAAIASFDIWVMLVATAMLMLVAISGWRIKRREGGLMVLGYVSYVVYQLRALA